MDWVFYGIAAGILGAVLLLAVIERASPVNWRLRLLGRLIRDDRRLYDIVTALRGPDTVSDPPSVAWDAKFLTSHIIRRLLGTHRFMLDGSQSLALVKRHWREWSPEYRQTVANWLALDMNFHFLVHTLNALAILRDLGVREAGEYRDWLVLTVGFNEMFRPSGDRGRK